MTDTTSTQTAPDYATALELVRDAYVSSDVDGLTYRLDGDQVTAILEVGSEFFAISLESGDEPGYSWAWGERTTDDETTGEVFTDYFGEDGGTTEAEARQAITEWLARFSQRREVAQWLADGGVL